MQTLHNAFPSQSSMAMGFHPTEVTADNSAALKRVEPEFAKNKYVAVGEIGIDLYWDKTFRTEQLEVLDTQLHWASEMNLPFIIHCREGLDEVLEVFDNFSGELPKGVFHSFTGSQEEVEKIRARGDFYFGINGIVTFKKASITAILPIIGIDRILLETDSPYLTPVPNRGKRNESSNIPYICACIASHLGLTSQEVSAITDTNAANLFGI